ncbi:MerR family transcriptional regulator [Deinococcus sp. Arct2-2]|uniref:MerR family transcriptional regulator n=1 Tax=Deinococcus sp. Arct2-2 TaxID=2568653 RepID=UPI001454BE92|nr:MerR family transcriptional regulator [Deinococcus sp. Arct2-2]
MRPLMSIGHFSEMTGLSIRALRLYEQQGLLAPAAVDLRTGYRFYRWHQRTVAERIRSLRELEMPLELIARCLHGGLELGAALERHGDALEAELQERLQTLRRVREAQTTPPWPDFEVRVRQQRAWPVLSVRYYTSLSRCEADRREGYCSLRQRAAQLGTRAAGPPHAHHPPQGGFDPDHYAVALSLPVRLAVPGSEPGFGGRIAFTRLCGDVTRLLHAYQALSDWLARSPHLRAGPSAERYLCRLRPGAAPHTEVWAPLHAPLEVL